MCAAFAVKLSLLIIISHLGSATYQQCMNFNSPFLSNTCGYNHTVKFRHDEHFDMFLRQRHHIGHMLGNCSEYSDIMLCSLILPRCKEDLYGPYLPCKGVCDEFANDCRDQLIKESAEWLVGYCQLLPESDDPKTTKGYLGRCFEPPGFKPSSGDRIPHNCSKVVVPLCQGLGYDETYVDETTQRKIAEWLPQFIGNYTYDKRCGELTRQWKCANFIQPCKDNTPQTLCRHRCEKMFETCELYPNSWLDKDICMEFPEGETSAEICSETHWPRFKNWPKPITTTTEIPSAATAASKSETLKVVIPVVVSLVFALILVLGLVGFLLYRRRQARQYSYEKQLVYNVNHEEELDETDEQK